MDRFYTLHRQSIAAIITEARPGLSSRAVSQRAAIVAMLIEGLLLIMGHGKPSHAELRGLRTEVIRQCNNIINLDE